MSGQVYIVEGYFGSDEWIESVWSTEAAADLEMQRLWLDRKSDKLAPDDYKQGLCKFDITTHEVRT